jgi:type II secretory pathway pseudopilin PulG
MKTAAQKQAEGMTLVEVMLAVTILGLGFAVLLTGASRCLGVVKLARNYQEAQWTFSMGEADHPILETNAVDEIAVAATTYDNGFTYAREVEEDDDEDGLVVVRSRVTWSSRGKEVGEEIVSLLYRPVEEE